MESILNSSFIFHMMVLVGIILTAVYFKNRYFIFGMLWFLITLIPVLSIFKQVHPMLMSLRYLYIPSIGLSISLAITLQSHRLKFSYKNKTIIMVAFIALLCIITLQENKKWSNELVIFKRLVADNPESSIAHFYLGNTHRDLKQFREAVQEYQKSLKYRTDVQILPFPWVIHNELSNIYDTLGLTDEAISMAEAAIRLNPDYYTAHYNLGVIYAREGRLDEALEEYKKAIKIRFDSPDAHYNLGNLYAKNSMLSEAIREYSITLSLRPDHDDARNNLVIAYFMSGDYEAAKKELGLLKTLNPQLMMSL